jgi:hypothetical protein
MAELQFIFDKSLLEYSAEVIKQCRANAGCADINGEDIFAFVQACQEDRSGKSEK